MRIVIENLSKKYYMHGNEIPVLRGMNFVAESGDCVALTGPSGVGKSTFLHILGTLDHPTTGRVTMGGTDVFGQSPAGVANFRNCHIGFVFQFHHLLPEFTALENVMMPGLIDRRNIAKVKDRASALLDDVGLGHRFDHRPGELSGGEQQRVALARALVNDPQILLADEPTGNLDEKTGRGIHEMIERLNQDRGITVILVTHNPRLAKQMPRQVTLTKEGIKEGVLDVDDTRPEPPHEPVSFRAEG